MYRIIIHELRLRYKSFNAIIQGQPTQLMLIELENLLANQRTLAKNWLESLLKVKRKHSLAIRKQKNHKKNENKNLKNKENESQLGGTCQRGNKKWNIVCLIMERIDILHEIVGSGRKRWLRAMQ